MNKKSTQDNFFESKIILDNLLENMPAHVYWKNKQGVYLGCNDKQAKSLGFKQGSDIIGKTDFELPWDLTSAEKFWENDQSVIKTGKVKTVEETATVDEHLATVLSLKIPLKDTVNHIQGVLGISIDITERKQMEEKLKIAKEQAEASDRAKSEFMANMSHDVKTPLAGMIGLSEVLMNQLKNPQDIEKVKMIYQGSKQLLHFFENCLDLVKSEQGDVSLEEKDFSLLDMLSELTELFKPSFINKGLTFKTIFDEKMPDQLHGSRAGLYRILLNLLSNAIKFTKKGSITLDTHFEKKSKASKKINLIINISDTGIGIPTNKIHTIFDRFNRVAPSYKGTYEGYGIGLHIVKKFVTQMGGNITVKSELNEGTCFTIQLPFSIANKKPVHQSKKNQEPQHQAATYLQNVNKKILLVEDNAMAQMAAKSLLNHLGYQVEIADCGMKVLDNFEPKKYDLIFMDIGLPDLEGTEVTRRLRKIEKDHHTHVPIIALSAHAASHIEAECLEAGMDEVVSKPLSIEKINEKMEKYFPNVQRGL